MAAVSLAVRLAAGYHWLHDRLAGVAGFDQALISQATVQTRAELERMLVLSVAGELSGMSLVPPDLILRLMPHCVPLVFQWRRKVGQSDDLTAGLQAGC